MTSYLTLDVFTDTRFGGNPLAVIPDATHLPEDDLQRIAREFNYSETTFVYPPKDPSHTAHVRIFTPTMEVPFAGHPLIGTAVALQDRGPEMVFETGVGPIALRAEGGQARFTTTVPLQVDSHPAADHIAPCLGLSVEQIAGQPTQAGVGLPFVLTELTTRAALSACAPVTDHFRENAKRYPSKLDFAVFAYVKDGNGIDARMFAPLDDIPEDPATGSASAALGAFLGHGTYDITQGEDMGRTSHISVSVDDGGVTVAGQAVPVMKGKLL